MHKFANWRGKPAYLAHDIGESCSGQGFWSCCSAVSREKLDDWQVQYLANLHSRGNASLIESSKRNREEVANPFRRQLSNPHHSVFALLRCKRFERSAAGTGARHALEES